VAAVISPLSHPLSLSLSLSSLPRAYRKIIHTHRQNHAIPPHPLIPSLLARSLSMARALELSHAQTEREREREKGERKEMEEICTHARKHFSRLRIEVVVDMEDEKERRAVGLDCRAISVF
jgi:hypothetical protein